VATGAAMTIFHGHPAPVLITNIVFSRGGRTVFTGEEDDFVRQWDAATREEIRTNGQDFYGIALSLDGQMLAAGDQNDAVTPWDVGNWYRLWSSGGHAGLVLRVAFSRDGTHLASAGFGQLAKLWDMTTGAEAFILYGNQSNVFGVSFSSDGTQLATAVAGGTVRFCTLALDELVALAEAHLTHGLTKEERRKFLHTRHALNSEGGSIGCLIIMAYCLVCEHIIKL
jgi:WD40 repeat protein